MSKLTKDFREQGLEGLASLLDKIHLTNFAEWRWGTLAACCKTLSKFIESLGRHWDQRMFAGYKDGPQLLATTEALTSVVWKLKFEFVLWVSSRVADIMSWAHGCACHEVQLRAGEKVDCPFKGHRQTEAYNFAKTQLDAMLAEAQHWLPARWAVSLLELLVLQGCIRNLVLSATLGKHRPSGQAHRSIFP